MHKTKITIRGIVQNVGLRAQIKAVADGLGVCGTVGNLRDGSVLVVCEAERADIEEMVRQIRSRAEMAVIKDVLVEEGPPATGMEGFEIMRGDSGEELLSAISTGTQAVVGILTTLNEMKQGQAQTNETLARMEQGQARLEKG
ncbi:MAG: acylphosphatase, partial [Thaumarchaeota archaeon]|nr:acylphosphatase [Nitrososphaerota archaeon]